MAYTPSDRNTPGIANFEALKTAIANGETQFVEQLLPKKPMLGLEKSYLIELAKLHNNSTILSLLEAIPEQE